MYTHLQNKLCKELEALEDKYRSGAEMSEGDLRKIDLLTHSMKSLKTYIAMKEAEDYNYEQQEMQKQSYRNMSYNYPHNNSSYHDDVRRDLPYREERRW